MRMRYGQFLNALQSAQKFLDANNPKFANINASATRKQLDAVTDAIATYSVNQEGGKRQTRDARQTELKLAAELKRKFMRPIAKIALAHFPGDPILNNIRVTPPNATTRALITRAGDMATFVEAHADVFADLGDNAGARVRAAIAGVQDAITGKALHRGSKQQATLDVETTVAQARRVVSALDSVVKAELDGTDTAVENWTVAVKVIRTRLRGGADPVAPVAAPPVTNVTKAAA